MHKAYSFAKASTLLTPTLRKVAAEVTAPSHKLALRAGLIRSAGAAGLYCLLPAGSRALDRVTALVKHTLETDVDAQPFELPLITPANLWQTTGRWDAAGAELWRLKDRKGADFCLAATAEESITSVVGATAPSFRDLPLRLYQTQHKARDEIRPRGGLLRTREFTMKDMYTFDSSPSNAVSTYIATASAYNSILSALNLSPITAIADAGVIGGTLCHEFHVAADVGEDDLLVCSDCGYAANSERAASRPVIDKEQSSLVFHRFHSQSTNSLAVVALNKALQPSVTKLASALSVPADSLTEMEIPSPELRVSNLLLDTSAAVDWSLLSQDQAEALCKPPPPPHRLTSEYNPDSPPASASVPTSLPLSSAPEELQIVLSAAGSAVPDSVIQVGDWKEALAGDPCPDCDKGSLGSARGIEVGHVFYLGTKYSSIMDANFTSSSGSVEPLSMGCYGIGLTRLLAASIEVHADDNGLRWPWPIAPFRAVVIPIGESRMELASGIASTLSKPTLGLAARSGDVVLDDRIELSPGKRFVDADLIGYPLRIVLGRSMDDAHDPRVEVTVRMPGQAQETTLVPVDDLQPWVQSWLNSNV